LGGRTELKGRENYYNINPSFKKILSVVDEDRLLGGIIFSESFIL